MYEGKYTCVAVKLDLKCSSEKACIRFGPVLCRLRVGNKEGVRLCGEYYIWNSNGRGFFVDIKVGREVE